MKNDLNICDQYMNDISLNECISQNEINNLFIKYRNGDMKAYEKLIISNLRLVVSIAKKYFPYNGDNEIGFLDIIQEGNIGLIKAVESYEVERGVNFSSYATIKIESFIRRAICNKKRAIRIPVCLLDLLSTINKYIYICQKEKGIYPTVKQIADHFSITEKKVEQVLSYNERIKSTEEMEVYLDDILLKNEDMFIESLEDKVNNQIYLDQFINDLKKILSPREYYIFLLRYGFDENGNQVNNGLTLDAIGKQFGVTRQNIYIIEKSIISKIQKYYKREDIKLYLKQMR